MWQNSPSHTLEHSFPMAERPRYQLLPSWSRNDHIHTPPTSTFASRHTLSFHCNRSSYQSIASVATSSMNPHNNNVPSAKGKGKERRIDSIVPGSTLQNWHMPRPPIEPRPPAPPRPLLPRLDIPDGRAPGQPPALDPGHNRESAHRLGPYLQEREEPMQDVQPSAASSMPAQQVWGSVPGAQLAAINQTTSFAPQVP